MMARKHQRVQTTSGTNNHTSDVTSELLKQLLIRREMKPESCVAIETLTPVHCLVLLEHLTCLKLCLYSLQAVSTVNLVLKMLQSLAP